MRYFIYTLTIFCLFGCASENDEPIPDGTNSEIESTTIEYNKWVYAQMDHYYLWREDMPSADDCDFTMTQTDFYESLLSPKDRFSYMLANPYYSSRSTEEHTDFGFAYQTYADVNGDEAMHVLYVNSEQARQAGLRRGDFLRQDYNTGDMAGFSFMEVDNTGHFICSPKSPITLPASRTSIGGSSTVLLDSIYFFNGKKIGYLCYLEYDSKTDLNPALSRFYEADIDELILDLRYNPGGYVNTCKYLCNCIVPPAGYGEIFQRCSYNDVLAREYEAETGSPYTFDYYDTPTGTNENTLGARIYPLQLDRMYVLVSKNTASASEATVVCTRPFMESIIIGETTIGKGVGSWMIYDKQYRLAIQPITMRYYNALGETTPDEGLTVDYYIPDGYSTRKRDIGDTAEPLLNQALQLIAPGAVEPVATSRSTDDNAIHLLTPIGEPSFVVKFNQKLHDSTTPPFFH